MISTILLIAVVSILVVIGIVAIVAAAGVFLGLSIVVLPLAIILGIIWLFKAVVNIVL